MMLYTGEAESGRKCQYAGTRLKRMCVQLVTKWRDEAGAELLEAALVLPVLLMLLLGIVTFGRAWNVYQTITRAAREGAREAVLTPCALCSGPNYTSPGDIFTNFVNPALQADNLDPTTVANPTVTYVYMDPTDPSPYICGVQVHFEYPFAMSIPFTTLKYSTINLSTTVQMRMENPTVPCPIGQTYIGPNP